LWQQDCSTRSPNPNNCGNSFRRLSPAATPSTPASNPPVSRLPSAVVSRRVFVMARGPCIARRVTPAARWGRGAFALNHRELMSRFVVSPQFLRIASTTATRSTQRTALHSAHCDALGASRRTRRIALHSAHRASPSTPGSSQRTAILPAHGASPAHRAPPDGPRGTRRAAHHPRRGPTTVAAG